MSENRRAYKAQYNKRRKEASRAACLSVTTPLKREDIGDPGQSTTAAGFESVGVEATINFLQTR